MIPIDNYVTGSRGFIGSNLTSKLTGNTRTIPHSLIGESKLEEFRRFFFLSAYGNMSSHRLNTWDTLRANVVDLSVVLSDLENLPPCESFLFVSTSSVTLPVQTTYSRTKRAGEEMVLSLPIPGCVVRTFSVTGVGEQESHLIPALIRSCFEGTSMDLVMSPVHDYIDVNDVTDGLVALADNKATGVFEFGSGEITSNEEVLKLVESACGKKANVRVVHQLRSYDTGEWRCRDFRSKDFGWNYRKPLKQSIQEMVESYKQNEHA